ncbi:MFS transporter [Sporomusa aerivorans]|uniref:MFS transporter n=1 Tax=Sporomusa aerivorans TaxID=204936 RepID=UPI003529F3EC
MKNRFLWLLSAGHLFADLNQGALPAILPFLIAEYNLSYAAAAGLVFAASFVSSVVQPLFGYFADKSSKPWLMPGGILLAGCGLAAVGFLSNYWLIFAAVTVSGVGIAAFHPEAARMANKVSGEKKGTGISIFSVGGNAGFALGPVITTASLLFWGLKGTLILIVPAAIMAAIIAAQAGRLQEFQTVGKKTGDIRDAAVEKDEWAPFSRLTVVIFCRSIIFYSLNTFLPLYWINILQQSKAAGGSALTILFMIGAVSTLFGGQLADRFGYNKIIRIGFVALLPFLAVFTMVNNVALATILLIPIGMTLFAPNSPMTVLGQKYLPNRLGLASGVTLGLAVSVGGITAPMLGWFADKYGLPLAMELVTYLSIIPAVMAFTLPAPQSDTATGRQFLAKKGI